MTRARSIAMAGSCVLAAVLLFTPSVQGVAEDAIGIVAESAVKSLLRPLWPFGRGKCFNLGRFDPTCLRYL